MKKFNVLIITMALFIASCSGSKDRYVDLRTGKPVMIEKDSHGVWVDADSKKPVYIYVDTEKHDTIYGRTGRVINGHVVRGDDNVYWYDADSERHEASNGEYKKKVDSDGDIKIKTENAKIKIDGETGEKKVKAE